MLVKNKTYIIAEIGINHNGNINLAKELIDSASRAGADAVKFQTYITEKRVPEGYPKFDLLKKCELSFDSFIELKKYSEGLGIDFFSTPFDEESVGFLESINVDLYKIASFDLVNHKLLKSVSKTGKPVILSVGMSNLNEIKEAHSILKKGTDNVIILHCISSYPTQEKDCHLSNIYKLRQEFDCIIGQSDHTSDIKVPLYAIAAGAKVIEKHFKIDDKFECVDSKVSITESQMSDLVLEARRLESILGVENFGIRDSEKNHAYREFRKS